MPPKRKRDPDEEGDDDAERDAKKQEFLPPPPDSDSEDEDSSTATGEKNDGDSDKKEVAAPATTPKPGSIWAKAAGKKPGAWNCAECLSENPAGLTECAACGAAKSGGKSSPKKGEESATKPKLETSVISSDSAPVPKTTLKPGSIWAKAAEKKPGSWNCPDCLSENPTTNTKCAACGAIKPGEKATSNAAESSAPVSGFKFGTTTQSESTKVTGSGFKFGTTASTESKPASGFVFGSKD